MRLLFVSKHFPDDPRTKVHGVYKRMGMFIDAIKEIAELDMLFFIPADNNYSPSQISDFERSLRKLWGANINLILAPMSEFNDNAELRKWISFARGIFDFHSQKGYAELSGPNQINAFDECLNREPDAIFAHRLPSMCPALLSSKHLPPIFFDLDDIEHVVLSRYIKQKKSVRSKLLYSLIPALISGERKAVKMAVKTYVCSENDRLYVSNKLRGRNVVNIPNAVRIPELQKLTQEPHILFLGSDYVPNVAAAEFLVNSIWPIVHREVPDAKLIVAGISNDKFSRGVASTPCVEFPGFVDDLDGLYQMSRVIAIPILVGSGTRYKIIEAAAYGKPIISTGIGAEGIDLDRETEILIRNTPETFAQACITLLQNSSLCEKIGTAAREKAIALYDRNVVVGSIRESVSNHFKFHAE